ncbi:Structure-specific endonuclease subunit Slx4 [Ceraceosorus bombacis]|uniref:Structure-specific endonuclease subunit SLX4 n=1 Tax=Ceraceosorus bombacis TaxID=401625 RepID=A0A0P1BF82_9BASI|nr:Structure-specific endonuclease subunit Slx4 [Ceraceosorus bombacis]
MGLMDELDALGGASTGRSLNSEVVRKRPSMTNEPLSRRARRNTKDAASSTVRDAVSDSNKCADGGAESVIETIEIEDSPIRPATSRTNTDASGEMPKYVSWSLEALQTECKKYGFKAGRDKDVLVEHLIACWRVLNHPSSSKEASVSSPLTERRAHQAPPLPSSSAGDTTTTTSQWSLGVADGEEAEAGDLTVQLTNEAVASSQQTDVLNSSSDTEATASSAEDSEAPLALGLKCKKYGFKAGRDKDVLVEHLIACWRVLNHSSSSKEASVSSPLTERWAHQAPPLPSSSAGDTTTTTSQWSLGVANGEEAEAGDLTVQLTNEAVASSQQTDVLDSSSDTEATASSAEDSEAPLALGLNRRASGSRFRTQVEARAVGQTTRGGQNDEEGEDSDEGEPESAPVDVSASLSAQLVQAVRADAQLYRRILLLEPISFDEVASVALKAHIRLKNKDVLRDWLDMQGICFYTGELTGTRSRY